MITHKSSDSWSKTSPRRLGQTVSLLTCFNFDNKHEVVEAGVDSKNLNTKFLLSEKNENIKKYRLKNL